MSTANSPVFKLRKEATRAALVLKGTKRTDKPTVTFAIVMDDKTLKCEMTWSALDKYSVTELRDLFVARMRESAPAEES